MIEKIPPVDPANPTDNEKREKDLQKKKKPVKSDEEEVQEGIEEKIKRLREGGGNYA